MRKADVIFYAQLVSMMVIAYSFAAFCITHSESEAERTKETHDILMAADTAIRAANELVRVADSQKSEEGK